MTDVSQTDDQSQKEKKPLRYGWTTGSCATAAAKAAAQALLKGVFPSRVQISLPRGGQVEFDILSKFCSNFQRGNATWFQAAVLKDAGDDPDVTHGATIICRITAQDVERTQNPGFSPLPLQKGPTSENLRIRFLAGEGVGTVTKPGLTLLPGEPAINPVPRQMIERAIFEVWQNEPHMPEFTVEIAIPEGDKLARRTLNGRLGIVGGLSILGTTGIVKPFSCSAWIHSIHRSVDVARASGQVHLVAVVGSTSEKLARDMFDFPEEAFIDMGDFVGGLLKYLRRHAIGSLTIVGGFAKICKLAQGAVDLHSRASQVDFVRLASLAKELGMSYEKQQRIKSANTALEVLSYLDDKCDALVQTIAQKAKEEALNIYRDGNLEVEVIICDRDGKKIGRSLM